MVNCAQQWSSVLRNTALRNMVKELALLWLQSDDTNLYSTCESFACRLANWFISGC